MEIRTSTRRVGDVIVVDVRGRIVVGEESAKLRALVLDLLNEGHLKIVLNLAEVNYIDSSGLGTLVSSFTSVRKAGGDLKLAKLTEKVENAMDITLLDTVFDIKEDAAAAVKAFSSGAAAST